MTCCNGVCCVQGRLHWMSAFTSRLSGNVKLVGSTISCEGSPLHGQQKGKWRRNPHVQSYAVATDRVGFLICSTDFEAPVCPVLHCHGFSNFTCLALQNSINACTIPKLCCVLCDVCRLACSCCWLTLTCLPVTRIAGTPSTTLNWAQARQS